GRTKRTYDLTSSIVPRGTASHHVVELMVLPMSFGFLPSDGCSLLPGPAELGAIIQMRCMITARRRASATMAFFTPRRLAICMAQLFSQDHLVTRISSICAAS